MAATYDPTTHMITSSSADPSGGQEKSGEKTEQKPLDPNLETQQTSPDTPASDPVPKVKQDETPGVKRTRRVPRPRLSPKAASGSSPGQVSVPSRLQPSVRFRVSDRVKTLPGERPGKHKSFVERARRAFPTQSLLDEFILADLTNAHRQVARYCAFKEDAESRAIKDRFFELLKAQDPEVYTKPSLHLWKDGQPTKAGRKALAKAGMSVADIAAEMFVDNLSRIGGMDALIAHARAVRRDAAHQLERRQFERQRNSQVIDVPFRSAEQDQ
jgi:hypothetical protein